MIADTSGTLVTFDGATIGRLTSLRVNLAEASEFEVVTMSTGVQGTGNEAVPRTSTICSTVRAGTVSVSGIGGQWWTRYDVGKYGDLVITNPALPTQNFRVYIKSLTLEGGVNDVWNVSATFQMV